MWQCAEKLKLNARGKAKAARGERFAENEGTLWVRAKPGTLKGVVASPLQAQGKRAHPSIGAHVRPDSRVSFIIEFAA